ncbi:piercer of microtubule wall 2 protein-like isoform X1 [Ptychodera flava]|uniref:piercer of microtubule wall 2 protein-like isoform X1 n=1 Tax=Ptychodera flava TaxID=63121 RepID=UPI003969CCD5
MAGAENKLTLPHEVVVEESLGASQPTAGSGGMVPRGAKTSDYYRTHNIPGRFDNPEVSVGASPGNPIFSCMQKIPPEIPQQSDEDCFGGYDIKPQHPMYRTTNMTYGGKPPSVHTMPTSFHARTQKFSEPLGKCGMYRNEGFNTAVDVSKV